MDFKQSHYLVVVDFHSRYIELALLEKTTSSAVISHMQSIFARHGIPETVVSDNGPQYTSAEFAEFSSRYGFRHVTSSPNHPSGNGEAERAVRTVKDLLVGDLDPYLALLSYRNTPLLNGYSPAQMLMGRRLRTTVPVIPEQPDAQRLRAREESGKCRQQQNFRKHHAAIPLQPLSPGDQVWIRDRREEGTVKSKLADHDRSYVVQTPKGSVRRNRIHLTRFPNSPTPSRVLKPSSRASPSPEATQPQPMDTVYSPHKVQLSNAEPVVHAPQTKVKEQPDIPTSKAGTLVQTRSGRLIKTPARYQQ